MVTHLWEEHPAFAGDPQEVKDHIPDSKLQLLLRNELDDLDKDVERCVTRDHVARVPREERSRNACQTHLGGGVALALDAHDVDPQQAVEGLKSHSGHFGFSIL